MPLLFLLYFSKLAAMLPVLCFIFVRDVQVALDGDRKTSEILCTDVDTASHEERNLSRTDSTAGYE